MEIKDFDWNITCYYDKADGNGNEPAGFMECMALFLLEKSRGWDADFKPALKDGGGP